MINKTIVLKILDQKKVVYQYFEYDSNITEGVVVAQKVGKNVDMVFKTLVTVDNTNAYHVFCIPVAKTLDLKKAAKLLNKKSLDMIKQKDLEPLTGYVHGGCSPIGMKKKFPTYFDKSIGDIEEICVSGGRTGLQIQIKSKDLIKLVQGRILDLTL